MNRPKVIFIAVLAATSTSSRFGAEAAKQCYYPNGQIATGDSPCNPDDEASSCCGGTEGAQCLSNNVCSNPGGNPVRGTCTDQNWNSVECPRFCVLNPKVGPDLISCSNVTNTDTSYCCDHDPRPCCDSGEGRFDIFPSQPEVLARWDPEFRLFTSVAKSTSSSSSSSSSSTTSASSTKSPPHSSHPTSSAATTKSPVETTPSSSSSSASSSSSTTGLSTSAKAGIGVGAAIFALALIALAFVLLNRRNKKRQLLAEKDQSQQQQQQQQQGQYGNFGPAGQYGEGGQVYHEAEGGQGGWYETPGQGLWATKQRQEMDGQRERHELYTEERTAELPSHSWRG